MTILVLSAHPDDLELMAGGSVASWTRAGHEVRGLTITDGGWTDPEGVVRRRGSEAVAEEVAAASPHFS